MKDKVLNRSFGLIGLIAIASLGTTSNALAVDISQQAREACTPDAFRLCSAEIPDIPRVTACMIANKARLSAPCRAVFEEASLRSKVPVVAHVHHMHHERRKLAHVERRRHRWAHVHHHWHTLAYAHEHQRKWARDSFHHHKLRHYAHYRAE